FNLANPTSPGSVLTVLSAASKDQQVSLSWQGCAGAVTYTLYGSSSAVGPYTAIAGGLTGGSYVDTAVSNGSNYYYYLSAENFSGLAAGSSNQVSGTPVSTDGLPLAPTNVIVDSPSKKRISISWTAPSDATGATTYKIYRS